VDTAVSPPGSGVGTPVSAPRSIAARSALFFSRSGKILENLGMGGARNLYTQKKLGFQKKPPSPKKTRRCTSKEGLYTNYILSKKKCSKELYFKGERRGPYTQKKRAKTLCDQYIQTHSPGKKCKRQSAARPSSAPQVCLLRQK
jgi:hypothetical protein